MLLCCETNCIGAFHDLLSTLADALDIRLVWRRVADVANRILPHDCMTMSFENGAGAIVVTACSTDDLARVGRIQFFDNNDPRCEACERVLIIDDLRTQHLPIAERADVQDRVVDAGYRGLLGVRASAQAQLFGIEFWSRRPHAFSPD